MNLPQYKLVKSLSEVPESEIDTGGTFGYCTWERLKPLIHQAIGVRKDERILGILISEEGIQVKVEKIKSDEKT